MADGGRVLLAFTEESTWGTVPVAQLKKVAFATSEDFGLDTQTVLSNALRGDYIKPQLHRVDATGTGGFNHEFAYGDLDDFLEGALRSDWTAAIAVTGTFTAVDADNTFTRGSGSFVTDGWTVGMAGRSSGFATAANNGIFVVTAVAALTLTISGLDLADEAGGGNEVLEHDGTLKNGTTLKSYTIERQFADLTNKFISQSGARVSSFSLSAQAGQIVTGAVAFMSKKPTAIATATVGSGAYTESLGVSNQVMTGVDNVTGIFVANDDTTFKTAVTYIVSQIDVTFGSPLRPISALGTLGPAAIGGNSFEFTMTMRVYTDDNSAALWTDYTNFTEKAIFFRFVDAAGNIYAFYFPQVQISASEGPNSGGPDSDVYQNLTLTAEYDSNTAGLCCITRINV